MMATELLAELAQLGVEVTARAGRLHFDAPVGALTPALRALLVEHKTALLAELVLREQTAYLLDPRPDLGDDHGLWTRLLGAAYHYDGAAPVGLFGTLHGLRCYGCRLTSDGERVRLSAGEAGEEYAALRHKWLMGENKRLGQVLRKLLPVIAGYLNEDSGAEDAAATAA